MQLNWLTKPQRIYIDLVVSWLRSEIARLNNTLETIERTQDYNDEYVKESIKIATIEMRRIRKFINAN